jgi:hypothetical protein
MVKLQKNSSKKKRNGNSIIEYDTKARKINASTLYKTCTEQRS